MKYQDLKAGIRSHLEDEENTWHSRNLERLFIHGNHTFYTEKEAKAN